MKAKPKAGARRIANSGLSEDLGWAYIQEVIARSQHLGKMKRRMFLGSVTAAGAPAPGTEVLSQGKPVGAVVSSAAAEAIGMAGQIVVLFEASVDNASDLLIDGQAVQPMELPRVSAVSSEASDDTEILP